MNVVKKRFYMLSVCIIVCVGMTVFAQEKKDVVLYDSGLVSSVDEIPQFPGGVRGWQQFLQRNLDIRDAVRAMDSTAYVDYGLRQTAFLEFTVCEDGKVCDIEIVNKDKISPEFAREAVRVMKKSPKWQPGKLKGKAVRTRFKQSITAIMEF